MSLINEMLRNLERQHRDDEVVTTHSNQTITPVFDEKSSANQIHVSQMHLIMAMLTVALVTMVTVLYVFPNNSSKETSFISSDIRGETINLLSSNVARINQVTLEEVGQGVRLQFISNQTMPDYTIDAQGQKIIIDIDEAELTAKMPQFVKTPFIEGVSISHVDRRLIINLQLNERLNEQVKLQHYPLNSDEYEALVVELYPVVDKSVSQKIVQNVAVATEKVKPAVAEKNYIATEIVSSSKQTSIDKVVRQPVKPVDISEQDKNIAQKASLLIKQGNATKAERILRQFIGEYPKVIESRVTLATLYMSEQSLDAAEDVIYAGRRIDSKNNQFKKLHARLLMSKGNDEPALAVLRQSPPEITEDNEYFSLMAALNQRAGFYQQAANTYQELTQVKPNESAWWLGLAVSLESTKSPQQAMVAYQQVLKYAASDSSVSAYALRRVNHIKTFDPQ